MFFIKKIKVLIVDDSAMVRKVLERILTSDPEIEVIGTAIDPIYAVKKIKEHKPDVITLDIEMPRMDGLSFLSKLMSSYPLPVIMISSLTRKGADATLKALDLGAFDFVEKPQIGISAGLEGVAREIVEKVKAASGANMSSLKRAALDNRASMKAVSSVAEKKEAGPSLLGKTTNRIIALGASTGGTNAVRQIMVQLPYDMEPVIIVLHMPEMFTKLYAEGLNKACRMKVKEAEDREQLVRGCAYVAPGGKHLLVKRSGAHYYLKTSDEPACNGHRPSVDTTFFSIAEVAGENVAAMVLTGMGRDGALGLREIKDEGGWTAVQDEKTSVVFGMPKQALLAGGADQVLSLPDIAPTLIGWGRNR